MATGRIPTWVLGIDTSTLTASVALLRDGALAAESAVRVPLNHSDVVLPMVKDLVAHAGIALHDVELFAVGLGPGSFTGVRVGVASATGLAVATGKPLVGVSSLEALAAAALDARGPVAAALDARRGEIYLAVFRGTGHDRVAQFAPAHGTPEAMGRAARTVAGADKLFAIGDLDTDTWTRLADAAGGGVEIAPRVVGTPAARFVAAEAAAGRGLRSDDGRLEPIYVRASDAKIPST